MNVNEKSVEEELRSAVQLAKEFVPIPESGAVVIAYALLRLARAIEGVPPHGIQKTRYS